MIRYPECTICGQPLSEKKGDDERRKLCKNCNKSPADEPNNSVNISFTNTTI